MRSATIVSAISTLAYLASGTAIPDPQSHAIAKRSACDNGPWTTPQAIGGQTGTPWCETRWNAGGTRDVINGINVWSKSGTGIVGISFTYSGDNTKSDVHGTNLKAKYDKTSSVTFQPGETVSSLSLYGDGSGSRLGWISMKTSKGQSMEIGWTNKGAQEYQIDVGSGLLIGAYGGEGASIDFLGLLFLKSAIKKVSITNIQYTNLPTGTGKDLTPVALLDTTWGNAKSNPATVTVTATASQTSTAISTYSQTVMISLGQETNVELSAEVLGVGGKVTTGFKWSKDTSTTTGKSDSHAVTLGTTISSPVAPGHGVRCTMTAQKGEGSFDYVSDVTLTLQDGTKVTYSEKGTVKSTQFAEAYGSCVAADDPKDWEGDQDNLPKGLKIQS